MPEIRENLTTVNYRPRGTKPKWIVVHNTYNRTSREGTAYNNTVYFKNTLRNASANYFIDDGNIIWCCVKPTDTAWHCGEAESRNGCYNYNSIGIEVCETNDGWFTDKEIQTLTWLVQKLMGEYGIDADHVCRHHDVTGKNCPWYYVSERRWAQLKNTITEDDMAGYGEQILAKLNDRHDASGRGKEATDHERLCWMAAKQEKMQKSIDDLNEKLDKLIEGSEHDNR